MTADTLVGIDEVGRGCLAGPVWACAYVFRGDAASSPVPGLRDSKKLSGRQREKLAPLLQEQGWAGHGCVEAAHIDTMGIAPATFEAMRLALVELHQTSGIAYQRMRVVVDGNQLPRWDLPLGEVVCLVKADDTVPQVSAASVLAKVARDRLMTELDCAHPGYGFALHAGYGTPVHMAAIRTLGPSSQHRMSFAPMSHMAGAHQNNPRAGIKPMRP